MTTSDPLDRPTTRRRVLGGAAVVGAAAVAAAGLAATVAGCADNGSGTDDGSTDTGANGGGGDGGGLTIAAASVPVGGGTVVANSAIVVTQPSTGEYHAFSAICTHQGCLVSEVLGSAIVCTCHNSRFSAVTGAVLSGPAARALASRTVRRSGGTLTVS